MKRQPAYVESRANLSEDGRYRYSLTRVFDQRVRKCVLFIMLNPSTADSNVDDPTIRRCLGFARLWGFGSFCVVNLYAYRATDPKELARVPDPVGHRTDAIILATAKNVDTVVCAWGDHAANVRSEFVMDYLQLHGIQLHHIGPLTARKKPRHPLYLGYDLPLVPFE